MLDRPGWCASATIARGCDYAPNNSTPLVAAADVADAAADGDDVNGELQLPGLRDHCRGFLPRFSW